MADYTSTKRLGVIAIFLLTLIHWGWCKSNNCDVQHCKSLFQSVFKDFFRKGTQHLCRSSKDTIECANKCFRTFFPEFHLLNPNASVASEICNYDIEHGLNQHWSCISRHLHRLLSCTAISGSMTPTNVSDHTLKQLTCKKLKQFLDCPYIILQDCEEEAIDVVSKLFSKVFKDSMQSACERMSLNAVVDLPVAYSLNNNFLDTATCLDNFPHASSDCFLQYIQNIEDNILFNCRNSCGKPDGATCLPSWLISDFYIPVLSFGKNSCEQDQSVDDQSPQMQEDIAYISNLASVAFSKDITSTTNPANKNGNLVRSAKAKKMSVSFLDTIDVKAFTLNSRLNTKEVDLDEEPITDPTSNLFAPDTTVTADEDHREIVHSSLSDHAPDKVEDHKEIVHNSSSDHAPDKADHKEIVHSSSSGHAADNAKENHACQLRFCWPSLFVNAIVVLILL